MNRENYYEVGMRMNGSNAELLSNLKVTVYNAGTTNVSSIYRARTGLVAQTNPIITGDDGLVSFWAEPGQYDVKWEDTQSPARYATRTVGFNSFPAGNNTIPASFTGSLTATQIADNSVGTAQFADGAVTTAKKTLITTVTSLPGSPNNGDEIYYSLGTNDSTHDIQKVWHLKYASYISKWLVLGGSPLLSIQSNISTQSTSSLTNRVDMTNMSSISLPLAGFYNLRAYGQVQATNIGTTTCNIYIAPPESESNKLIYRSNQNEVFYGTLQAQIQPASPMSVTLRISTSSSTWIFGGNNLGATNGLWVLSAMPMWVS